ncbi:NAD(P)H pyrophosphatase NUDT13, mitochondrial-like [Amphibalanus amphitrite]|uniref:NAD(P)H pyrophosphatase NUDT13, mitochondrial-like n=1 Tax=Amphibalanus amphitrite TaxID=1232801 RepID=UPI001C90190B|nr:NAD(P)H pyrophosphatase NUDT13, mitochondrial-like [Amphibalanus amphitrite]
MISCKALLPAYGIISSFQVLLRHRSMSTLSYVQRIKLLQALKEDDDKIVKVRESGRVLPFVAKKPLISMPEMGQTAQTLRWISFSDLQRLYPSEDLASRSILLNVADTGQACFTADLPGGAGVAAAAQAALGGKFVDPRAALFLCCPGRRPAQCRTRFRCCTGATRSTSVRAVEPLRSRPAGHAKNCPSCETVQYPMTSPVGITMITDAAQTRALLVRQGRHPPGMYSCVAGFLEPGETIESCIRREVAEEVGIDLDEVGYMGLSTGPSTAVS